MGSGSAGISPSGSRGRAAVGMVALTGTSDRTHMQQDRAAIDLAITESDVAAPGTTPLIGVASAPAPTRVLGSGCDASAY